MRDFSGNTSAEFNFLCSEINYIYHRMAVKLGLSDSVMTVLYTLCNFGEECPLGEIIRCSGISKQTVNSALRKLESDGMIVLRPFGGKQKMVCLTASGKALADSTVARVLDIEREIFDSWTTQEQEIYLRLTQMYINALQEKASSL